MMNVITYLCVSVCAASTLARKNYHFTFGMYGKLTTYIAIKYSLKSLKDFLRVSQWSFACMSDPENKQTARERTAYPALHVFSWCYRLDNTKPNKLITYYLTKLQGLQTLLCGISHTLSRPANFIYLFVHERDLLVTWFLSVSREDWVPVFSVL